MQLMNRIMSVLFWFYTTENVELYLNQWPDKILLYRNVCSQLPKGVLALFWPLTYFNTATFTGLVIKLSAIDRLFNLI